jgi:hypothetical protein
MMLGLGGLRNPLIIGQMMGATISAESHESDYGGVIPKPNVTAAIAKSTRTLGSGFFSRNGDGVDAIKSSLVC